MILKGVDLVPEQMDVQTLDTESPSGLKYAVVYQNRFVIALFDDAYWANRFVTLAAMGIGMKVREVAE